MSNMSITSKPISIPCATPGASPAPKTIIIKTRNGWFREGIRVDGINIYAKQNARQDEATTYDTDEDALRAIDKNMLSGVWLEHVEVKGRKIVH